nr:immunoglobulin heavy chain junction region [Mus musculus]NSM06126.1 immunoglobulin heavy chain junction region [Mus musculus]NSM06713.1 immunoglobulin heavy chain junction region [Mus musculus]NSM07719.1 immunoglobulin heavy chain junction region [Mus musculus]NSM08399.1 immunoglobulin heavy chain junction region [Mus musculus]
CARGYSNYWFFDVW